MPAGTCSFCRTNLREAAMICRSYSAAQRPIGGYGRAVGIWLIWLVFDPGLVWHGCASPRAQQAHLQQG